PPCASPAVAAGSASSTIPRLAIRALAVTMSMIRIDPSCLLMPPITSAEKRQTYSTVPSGMTDILTHPRSPGKEIQRRRINHVSVPASLSHTTTLAYDSRSRETSTTDPLGHTATMAYDSASNMTGQTDMRGNPTTYTYDNEGRLLTTLLPGNTNPSTNSYDAAGKLTAVSHPLG